MVGVTVPLVIMVIVRRVRGISVVRDCAEFFAGFCLIANGAYIGIGSIDGIGDAGDLLRHGAAAWELVVFGAVSSIGGLLVWHLALKRRRATAI